MGEDRQEYSRIVTDMSGQNVDSTLMETLGGPAAVGMEQVQYQSGDVLGNGPAQELEQYREFNEMNNDQEVIDVLNQWPPSGMDFSVGFEPFDLDSYCINMGEPLGLSMR